jgi:hypothetical protein
MVIDTYIIYESLEGLSCYIIGGVGIPVSLRHNGLSVVRIKRSSQAVFLCRIISFICFLLFCPKLILL